MPRTILLGRIPKPGEPWFLPDDTAGALELQLDEDMACPRGHHLDETVGDEGPAITARNFVCEACAAEDEAKRAFERDATEDSADLLYGRYFTAVIAEPD